MSNPDAPPAEYSALSWDEKRAVWRDYCREYPCSAATRGLAAGMCRICIYEAKIRKLVMTKVPKPYTLTGD